MASKWKSLLTQIQDFVSGETEKQTDEILKALDTSIEIITAENEWNSESGGVSKEDIEDLKQKILATYDDVELSIQKTEGVYDRVVRAEENLTEVVRDNGDRVVEEVTQQIDSSVQHYEEKQDSTTKSNTEDVIQVNQVESSSEETKEDRKESVLKRLVDGLKSYLISIKEGVNGIFASAKEHYLKSESENAKKTTKVTLLVMAAFTLFAALKSGFQWIKQNLTLQKVIDKVTEVTRSVGRWIVDNIGPIVSSVLDKYVPKLKTWFEKTLLGKIVRTIEAPFLGIIAFFKKIFGGDMSGWEEWWHNYVADINGWDRSPEGGLIREYKETHSPEEIKTNQLELRSYVKQQIVKRQQSENPQIWNLPEGVSIGQAFGTEERELVMPQTSTPNFQIPGQSSQGNPTIINNNNVTEVNQRIVNMQSNGTGVGYYNGAIN